MKAIKITIILEQPDFTPYSEDVAREILGSQYCFGVYRRFTQDNVTFEEVETGPLKYLQDMTVDDYKKIIGVDSFEGSISETIKRFKSLYGFMYCIALLGNFKSYPTAKALGYDVEFTLPIKK